MINPTEHSANSDKVISVLLIEDVASERNSILQAISQKGAITDLNIMTANSLKDGMEKLAQHPADVVLLDLDLPDSKSLQSVSTVLRHFPDTAIVILSGHSEEGILTEALMMGAQEFLVKGECSGVMIRHTIHQAVARRAVHKQQQYGWKKVV